MKKLFVAGLILLLCAVSLSAQDIITKKTGEDIKAKVTEVLDGEVKYKLFDYLDGPTYSLRKSEIVMIRYANGTNEVMQTKSYSNNGYSGQYNYGNNYGGDDRIYATNPGAIRPGMKYKTLKHYYNVSDYYEQQPGDMYSPSRCLWNLLLTGLGQMTMGEAGRGIGYLGSSIGIVTGCSLIGASVDDPDVALILGLIGSSAALAINIMSIVDAAKVAKVKTLYNRDLRNLTYVPEVKLSPYITPARTANGMQAAAGFALTMNF